MRALQTTAGAWKGLFLYFKGQFTIGTGGEDLDTDVSALPANVESANDQSYGVSKFILNQRSYSWRFTSAIGSYTDAGSASCHGAYAHHR